MGSNKFYSPGQFYKGTLPYTPQLFEQVLKYAIPVPDQMITDPGLFDCGIYLINLSGEKKIAAICYPETKVRAYGQHEWNEDCIDKFVLEAGQGVLYPTDPCFYIFSVLDKTLDTSALAQLLTSDLGITMADLQNRVVTIKRSEDPLKYKISVQQGLLDNHCLINNQTGDHIQCVVTVCQPVLLTATQETSLIDSRVPDTGGPIVLEMHAEAGSQIDFLCPAWKYIVHVWEPMDTSEIVGGYPVKTTIPTARNYVEDDHAEIRPGQVGVLLKVQGSSANTVVVIDASQTKSVTSRIAIEKGPDS